MQNIRRTYGEGTNGNTVQLLGAVGGDDGVDVKVIREISGRDRGGGGAMILRALHIDYGAILGSDGLNALLVEFTDRFIEFG